MKGLYLYFAFMLLIIQGCATLPSHYISADDRQILSLNEILFAIRNERIIFLGEGHDREEDHLVQFEIIRRLHESGKRVAVALEMFPPEMQAILDQWIKDNLPQRDFERAYYSAWTVPYNHYENIFEFARQAKIPLIGINADEKLIGDAAKKGVKILPEQFRQEIGIVECSESPEYEKIMRFFELVSHSREMPFFCDAQLLRDTVMAHNILRFSEKGDYTIVVLAGSVHALKTAIPSILLKKGNLSSRVLMSKDFREIITDESDKDIADYLWY